MSSSWCNLQDTSKALIALRYDTSGPRVYSSSSCYQNRSFLTSSDKPTIQMLKG